MSKVVWFGDEILKQLEADMTKRLLRMVYFVERTVQELFREPKSGNTYQVNPGVKNGRTYTASAPGEAPAVRTGRLRQSITHAIEKTGVATIKADVGTSIADPEYPKHLEFGTSLMKARPAWRPALARLIAKKAEFFKPIGKGE